MRWRECTLRKTPLTSSECVSAPCCHFLVLSQIECSLFPSISDYFRQGLKAWVVLFPLLGLTWVFGIFSITAAGVVFQYIFTIFNSLQVTISSLNNFVMGASKQYFILHDSNRKRSSFLIVIYTPRLLTVNNITRAPIDDAAQRDRLLTFFQPNTSSLKSYYDSNSLPRCDGDSRYLALPRHQLVFSKSLFHDYSHSPYKTSIPD